MKLKKIENFGYQNYFQKRRKSYVFTKQWLKKVIIGLKISGAKRTRTADPLHAMQVLYQLSYGPKTRNVSVINLS